MSEEAGGSELESNIERAMRGEPIDIMPLFLQAELAVPSGGPIGERFEGFVPVLYDRDGIPMLAVFTTVERARMTADRAPYAVTMRGRDIVARMPDGNGVVVNPGYSVGFELLPDGVARVRAALAEFSEPPVV